MSQFTDFEAYERVPDTRKKYRLNAPIVWHIGKSDSGWPLSIPAGTVFDISVPRLLEWIQSPHDARVLLGAAIHDELLNRGFDASFASAEFRRSCIARGTSSRRAWMLFFATLSATAF